MFELTKKKQWVLLLIVFLLSVTVTSCGSGTINSDEPSEKTMPLPSNLITMTDVYSGLTEIGGNLSADILSSGGGGMLFNPQISPFDSNLFTVLADMGGMYISHNAGVHWDRQYFKNVVYTSSFDPNRDNVIYAGGAGLYRSTDKGESFRMIFPREDDVLEMHSNAEAYDVQIFTKSGIYPTYLPVCCVLVDPVNSDHIFVAAGYKADCMVYESTDNGDNFALIGTFTKEKYNSGGAIYELTELVYAPETDTLYMGVEEGVFRLNREKDSFESVINSSTGLADIDFFRKDGNTWLIYVEKDNPHEKSTTGVFATSDFKTITDLTDSITSNLSTSFHKIGYLNKITFEYTFNHVEAADLDQIYLSSVSRPTGGSYPYNICSILYYHGDKTDHLFGNPDKGAKSVENYTYTVDDTGCFGIAADWEVPGRFLESTYGGILYSPDGDKVYQLTTNVTGDESSTFYSSRGIDEHVVYKVVEDPFNKNHIMLLSTDWGLQESFDGGISFCFCNQGIPEEWKNTSYDLAFDKNKEGVVYSIWSGNHSGSWSYLKTLDTLDSGFAYSSDGGATWDVSYSSGLPDKCLPIEMKLVYPEDSDEVTIYIASHMDGFFVSYDSGRTFSPLNEGLEPVSHQEGTNAAHTCIPATDIETGDGRVFGIIQNTSVDLTEPVGGVYELVDGIWHKIDVRSFENGKYASIPKDINYYDGVLYINYVSYPLYLKSDNDGYYTNHGGGVITWDGKEINQIFDETCPTSGLQISSEGTIYISDLEGNIHMKKPGGDWEILYRHFHIMGAEIQLYDDRTLYFASGGGGALRLSGLDGL